MTAGTAAPRPPVPRSAYQLVIFVVDAAVLSGRSMRAAISDAIAAVVAELRAGPGGADHDFAAVVFGDQLVTVHPTSAPYPWDLAVRSATPTRVDGGLVAASGLATDFLTAAGSELPATADVLVLADPPAPGQGAAGPGAAGLAAAVEAGMTADPRVAVGWLSPAHGGQADRWWTGLAALRSARHRTVLLK